MNMVYNPFPMSNKFVQHKQRQPHIKIENGKKYGNRKLSALCPNILVLFCKEI